MPAQISKQRVFEDLRYLKTSLEKAHYDLYAHTSKEDFNSNFESVLQSINKDSLSLLEVVNLSQRIISKANTGHAEIDFPVKAYIEYAQNGGTLFPLELAFEDGKAYVRKNFSGHDELPIGAEILSINGLNMKKILEKIHPQLSGERTVLKNAKLEFWSFPRLYWQMFGQQDTFDVQLKNSEEIKVLAVSGISVMKFEQARDGEILNPTKKLKFYENTAYLQPGPFSSPHENGEELFKKFIDSAFTEIEKKDSNILIVDLRNNSGGHNAFSDHLVSYFADRPFLWHSCFSLKTSELLKEQTRKNNDTTDTYFRRILDEPSGSIYDYEYKAYDPVPESDRFNGEVYVLINRQTYSMASVMAAMVKDYGFATIVGEETADPPTLYASQFSYTLPNSGIVVKVPKGYIIRPNMSEKLQGVIPDIRIKDHLLDDKDEVLPDLLERINAQ